MATIAGLMMRVSVVVVPSSLAWRIVVDESLIVTFIIFKLGATTEDAAPFDILKVARENRLDNALDAITEGS